MVNKSPYKRNQYNFCIFLSRRNAINQMHSLSILNSVVTSGPIRLLQFPLYTEELQLKKGQHFITRKNKI